MSKSHNIAGLFFSVLIVILFTGCVSITPPTRNLSGLKTEEVKNYTLGQEYSVNVGESIIVRKSYLYKEAEISDRAKASNDFHATAKIPLNKLLIYDGGKDEELLVLGTTEIKGVTYRIISIGRTSNDLPVGMLATMDGKLTGQGVWRNGYGSWGTATIDFKIDRLDTQFTPVKSIEVDKSQQYENYEIVYTGKSGDNVTFVYREYTPEDLAKPAFYQNLTYNLAEGKVIQFRKLQMQVIEANNEQIKLKVLSDS
jgi:hypothetical protein